MFGGMSTAMQETAAFEDGEKFIVPVRALNALPAIADASDKGLACLALVGAGFSYRTAGQLLGISGPAVHQHVEKLDPNREYILDGAARNAVICALLTRGLGSYLAEALDPGKIAKLGAGTALRGVLDLLRELREYDGIEEPRRRSAEDLVASLTARAESAGEGQG